MQCLSADSLLNATKTLALLCNGLRDKVSRVLTTFVT